jgi:NADPH:quinone reductase-like Zn-dependent oxidoreductase
MGNLKSGQRVLIQGAAGGVGQFAVQLAKLAGAYVVASADAKDAEFLKSLGPDEVIDMNDEKKIANTKNIDLVFDTVGAEAQETLWKTIRKEGMLISTVSIDEDKAAQYGVIGKSFISNSNGARLQEIAGLIDKQMLKVNVAHEFRLEDAAKAQELNQKRKSKGKIVLIVSDTK